MKTQIKKAKDEINHALEIILKKYKTNKFEINCELLSDDDYNIFYHLTEAIERLSQSDLSQKKAENKIKTTFYSKADFTVNKDQHIFNVTTNKKITLDEVEKLDCNKNYLIVCDNKTGLLI